MLPIVITTAVTNGTTAATTQVINLPASGIIKGDILLAIVRNAAGGTYTWPAGWTELWDASDDGDDDENTIAWRISDGTDGTTVSITATASGKFAAYVVQIRGGRNLTPVIASTTGASPSQPDPPTSTPTGGSKDYLWGALAAYGGEPTGVSAYPTNYTLGQNTANSGTAGATTTNCVVAGAWRQLTGSTEDPGAFTVTGTLSNWTSFNVAIYPWGEPIFDRMQPGSYARLRR